MLYFHQSSCLLRKSLNQNHSAIVENVLSLKGKKDSSFLYSLQAAEACLQPSRTFMMEIFCKNSKLLTILAKTLHHRLLTES